MSSFIHWLLQLLPQMSAKSASAAAANRQDNRNLLIRWKGRRKQVPSPPPAEAATIVNTHIAHLSQLYLTYLHPPPPPHHWQNKSYPILQSVLNGLLVVLLDILSSLTDPHTHTHTVAVHGIVERKGKSRKGSSSSREWAPTTLNRVLALLLVTR